MAMDMNSAYGAEVRHQCPKAEIVFDLFHVVAKYGREVIDRVRVDEANRLRHDKKARKVVMPRDQHAPLVHQAGDVEAELGDRPRDLRHLLVAVGTGVGGIGQQPLDRPMLDLAGFMGHGRLSSGLNSDYILVGTA